MMSRILLLWEFTPVNASSSARNISVEVEPPAHRHIKPSNVVLRKFSGVGDLAFEAEMAFRSHKSTIGARVNRRLIDASELRSPDSASCRKIHVCRHAKHSWSKQWSGLTPHNHSETIVQQSGTQPPPNWIWCDCQHLWPTQYAPRRRGRW